MARLLKPFDNKPNTSSSLAESGPANNSQSLLSDFVCTGPCPGILYRLGDKYASVFKISRDCAHMHSFPSFLRKVIRQYHY